MSGQTWDAAGYAREGRFVADLAEGVYALLAPQAGERILDLGCGDGALTARLAAAGATVVGVDSSASMVAAARDRGLDARLIDGGALRFEAEFDAVFSNAALHWMRDHDAVLGGVSRALKPGGRFVAEMGGHGNIAAIRVALLAECAKLGMNAESVECNYFPEPREYAERLAAHELEVRWIELIPRPTVLGPGGMRGWLTTFRAGLLDRIPGALPCQVVGEISSSQIPPGQMRSQSGGREQFLREVEKLLTPVLRHLDGKWSADYVRLRFHAVRRG